MTAPAARSAAAGSTAAQLITQGEFALGDRPEAVISTILGSCVAVCLWSPGERVGGMNHILLPEGAGGAAARFGASDMERLINALYKRGIAKVALQAKMFGGGAIVRGLSDIGGRNVAFARDFLRSEGIPIVAESTGGTLPRQIRFWPYTGRVQLRVVGEAEAPEERPLRHPQPADVELFGD